MKNLYSIIVSVACISSFTTCSERDYWSNANKSVIALIQQAISGPSQEDQIPKIMQTIDSDHANNPEHLSCAQLTRNFAFCGTEYSIDQISTPITSGPTHQAFQHIVTSDPRLAKYPIQLRRSTCDMIQGPISISSNIILHQNYNHEADATKLFILRHELEHHLHNDVAENHLEKIINLQSNNPETRAQLLRQGPSLRRHILRYVEHRSDTKALEKMDCPHCLQEVTTSLHNRNLPAGTFHPQGYLCCWQFQPRINELLEEKKCCQHHTDTGKQINPTIINESTLLNRLKIVQE